MELTPKQKETEKELEFKYQGVLTYVDAKHFLDNTPYTAAKISGVIKRFLNGEHDREKPSFFIEMEPFVNDIADFWLDANPEVHTHGEYILHEALSNYMAFSHVWKVKAKSSQILTPSLMSQVGKMIVLKNALANATMIVNSRIAHDQCPNLELYKEFKNILPESFFIILPVVQGLMDGTLELPSGQTQEDLNRLIGGFLAGNPAITGIAQKLKLLDAPEKTNSNNDDKAAA